MAQIIAVANHKGGVGKTTTVFNLAHELAGSGRRVLMVDTDYQSSLTNMAGCADAPGHNIAQVMTGAPVRSVIVEIRAGLQLVPSDVELASTELQLIGKIGRENILRRALATVAGDYDIILIDCAPSLGLMTVNALAAAHGVIVPLQPTQTDLRALDLFLSTIGDVRAQINPGLQLVGLALMFYDGRYSLHGEAMQTLQAAGLPIVATIGRSVKVAEASGAHQAISEYEPGNPQIASYKQLTEAVITWLEKQQ
jgi:chromosome partitioning protein